MFHRNLKKLLKSIYFIYDSLWKGGLVNVFHPKRFRWRLWKSGRERTNEQIKQTSKQNKISISRFSLKSCHFLKAPEMSSDSKTDVQEMSEFDKDDENKSPSHHSSKENLQHANNKTAKRYLSPAKCNGNCIW